MYNIFVENRISWQESVEWLRNQPDQQDLVRACYFDDPPVNAAKRFASSVEWQAVQQLIGPPGHALDLGAGRGISSYALAANGWQVVALEPDPGALVGAGAIRQLASDTGLPISVRQSTAEELDLSSTFDLVYGREVLHHARDLRQMCCASARALKPGGMLLACREHVLSRKEDLPAFLEAHPLHRYYGGENAYLLQEYVDAILSSGLEIKKILGPYDSVINYFPATQEQVDLIAFMPVRRLLGASVASSLIKSVIARKLLLHATLRRRASLHDSTPGRLFTFLAVKPL